MNMNMTPIKVPFGFNVSVVIRREGDTAYVDVLAPCYKTKQWTMPHQYAASFSDHQILNDSDFIRVLHSRYKD